MHGERACMIMYVSGVTVCVFTGLIRAKDPNNKQAEAVHKQDGNGDFDWHDEGWKQQIYDKSSKQWRDHNPDWDDGKRSECAGMMSVQA